MTVSAVSLALLVSACGSSDKAEEKKDGKAADKGAASSAPAKVLTAAELEKAAVEQADLPEYKVEKNPSGKLAAAGKAASDKTECQALADAVSGPLGSPAAKVMRSAVLIPAEGGKAQTPEQKALAGLNALKSPATRVVLGSYAGGAAAEQLAAVKKAGTDCAGGFTVTQDGEKSKITKVAPLPLTAGEEATAFEITVDGEGMTIVYNVAVTRQGGTLSSFFTFSLGGAVKELPAKVIEAQAKKLG
ncbi:hypothetical protein LG634_13890 [Streptomyces bambusae]|uniref:hypothetical protein n=1 Tax=Streptomyces bambusae TaxID=1550616 RepID=UPI001CFECD0F|nr:hypothetical protein [Streptomyces bambusae]MCB5165923.1 hypothetical protein [Streptomyces bambusae]